VEAVLAPAIAEYVLEGISLMINPPVAAAADAPNTDKPSVAAPSTQPEINPPLREPAKVTAPNPNPAKK
jgi:hypothetical protein